jgi:CheY-like chemotaxis protein
MTQPLALVLYEKLLPGTQVVNRLQDLNYRVQECAEQAKPMVVVTDLESSRNNVCAALARLKQNAVTQHLPVIAFSAGSAAAELGNAARAAGATLVVTDAAILNHLPQFLEQALQVE